MRWRLLDVASYDGWLARMASLSVLECWRARKKNGAGRFDGSQKLSVGTVSCRHATSRNMEAWGGRANNNGMVAVVSFRGGALLAWLGFLLFWWRNRIDLLATNQQRSDRSNGLYITIHRIDFSGVPDLLFNAFEWLVYVTRAVALGSSAF